MFLTPEQIDQLSNEEFRPLPKTMRDLHGVNLSEAAIASILRRASPHQLWAQAVQELFREAIHLRNRFVSGEL